MQPLSIWKTLGGSRGVRRVEPGVLFVLYKLAVGGNRGMRLVCTGWHYVF